MSIKNHKDILSDSARRHDLLKVLDAVASDLSPYKDDDGTHEQWLWGVAVRLYDAIVLQYHDQNYCKLLGMYVPETHI